MKRITKILGLLALGIFLVGIGRFRVGILANNLFLLVVAVYSWIAFTFIHYRSIRQEEFLHLLSTAVESGSSLPAALRAYLSDRPRGRLREIWIAVLLFLVLPGYYWFWHRRHNYDRKIDKVARLLERDIPLEQALLEIGGVATAETILAVAVGQSTGNLALGLRHIPRYRFGPLWLETALSVAYPLGLLLFVTSGLTYWILVIAPKFMRMFEEYGMELPKLTSWVLQLGQGFVEYGIVPWCVLVAMLLVILLYSSSSARWHFPGLGYLYRLHSQSRVLRMLALLVEAGKPLPESLALVSRTGYLSPVIRSRLDAVRQAVENGESFPDNLEKQGLLPASMVPLTHAAQCAQNLPWALTEMAETLSSRSFRLTQRLAAVFFPIAVMSVGIVVGVFVIAVFIPLVQLISEFSG